MILYDNNLLSSLYKKRKKLIILSAIIFLVMIGLASIPCFYVTQESITAYVIFSMIPIVFLGFPGIYIAILANICTKKIGFTEKMTKFEADEYIGVITKNNQKITKLHGVVFDAYEFRTNDDKEIIFYVEDDLSLSFEIDQKLNIKLVENNLLSYEVVKDE